MKSEASVGDIGKVLFRIVADIGKLADVAANHEKRIKRLEEAAAKQKVK